MNYKNNDNCSGVRVSISDLLFFWPRKPWTHLGLFPWPSQLHRKCELHFETSFEKYDSGWLINALSINYCYLSSLSVPCHLHIWQSILVRLGEVCLNCSRKRYGRERLQLRTLPRVGLIFGCTYLYIWHSYSVNYIVLFIGLHL